MLGLKMHAWHSTRLRKKWESQGKVIGPQDTPIATIVLQHEGTLVTNRKDAFSRVEGLRVEDGTVGCRPNRASR